MTIKPRLWDFQKILEYGEFDPFMDVLEVGAMFGYFSSELAPLVKRVLVTDSWDWAERRFAGVDGNPTADEWKAEVEKENNVEVLKANAEDLPMPAEVFDRVVCISAIEHMNNDRLAIEEMMRVLKPGGMLLLTTEYNPTVSRRVDDSDGSFYRIYNHDDFYRLIKGFDLVAFEVAESEVPEDKFTTLFLCLKK